MTNNILKLMILGFAMVIVSCGDDDNVTENQLDLNLVGLQNLGDDFAYEGWILVDGSPKTTGVFTIDEDGTFSQTSFEIDEDDLEKATAFILTIEPSPDTDPAPSEVHILAGDFSADNATLTVSHSAAIGTDFNDAMGKYILATPTDGIDNNEESGVWFLDNSSGSPIEGLSIPTLPAGWVYEGWAVIDGTPVTTGTFSSASGSDSASTFSGSEGGPAYPGEDFLQNAPAGLTFPTNLQGKTIVVSVEPVPDNSDAPFLLKPLLGVTPENAELHTPLEMVNNATSTNPTGTATKK
jgi:hypothetical protein